MDILDTKRTFFLGSVAIVLVASSFAKAQDADAVYADTYGAVSTWANGISGNGLVPVGYSNNEVLGVRATAWSDGLEGFSYLDTPGAYSIAYNANYDASTIVGAANDASGVLQAVSWDTTTNTITYLSAPNSTQAVANGISDDGNTIVGFSQYGLSSTYNAVVWRNGETSGTLYEIPGGWNSYAYGVSADGNIIVGYTMDSIGNQQAVTWKDGNNPSYLSGPGGSQSAAFGVSADGNVIVGWSGESGSTTATYWSGGALAGTLLPKADASQTGAVDASGDGSVIVGTAYNAEAQPSATAWVGGSDYTMVSLPVLDGYLSGASAVSNDGNVIAGYVYTADYSSLHAALWRTVEPIIEPQPEPEPEPVVVTPEPETETPEQPETATEAEATENTPEEEAVVAIEPEVAVTYVGIDVDNTLLAVSQTANQMFSTVEMQRLQLGRLQNVCSVEKAGETCYSFATDVMGFDGNTDLTGRISVAHGVTENFSIGAALSYSLWRDLPDGFDRDNSNIGGGLTARFHDETADGRWYVKGSLAANRYDVGITRSIIGFTEAGTGDSIVTGWGISAELGRTHEISATSAFGYFGGLRYSDLQMDGYEEGNAYFPFTYSDLDYQLTTAYVGLTYEHKISERLNWSISGEIEQDLAHNDPSIHASADYIGAFEFNPDMAHTRASASTTLSYAVAEDVSIGLTPYVARTSTRDTAFGAMIGVSGRF